MSERDEQAERPLFKDVFSEVGARRLEQELKDLLPEPHPPELETLGDSLSQGFNTLELMDRSRLVCHKLCSILPKDADGTFQLLIDLATRWANAFTKNGEPLSYTSEAISPFWIMAMIDCIPAMWVANKSIPLNTCLETLKTMTRYFSAEFAIRPFLREQPDAVLEELSSWVSDPHPAVRRLVSEGTRPRLPWGIRLPHFVQNPTELFPLLNGLVDDPDEVVRRSVANNLNDISKDHPDLVLDVFHQLLNEQNPLADSIGSTRLRLIRHAGRTLIKKGNPGMLAILGYQKNPHVEVQPLDPEPTRVPQNQKVQLAWTLTNLETESQKLLLDYRIWFMKSNGIPSVKVFKGTETSITPGATMVFSRSFSFRPITTRKYYPGEHQAEILINGKAHGKVQWVYGGNS